MANGIKGRLSPKDEELLNSNQVVDLSLDKYAYLGGEFGTNPNDYVEILIYSGENLLETAVVDVTDYMVGEKHKLLADIRLKSGTILRKLGYDRGRFNVKYNFFRKVAGSHETLLVDDVGKVWRGQYHTMPDGSIMTGAEHSDASVALFLKENKYIIQEISDSRKEVRLIAQNIKDKEYKDNFYNSQKPRRKIEINDVAKFVSDAESTKGDSLTLELSDLTNNVRNVKSLIGGYVYLNNSFIEKTLPPPPDPGGTTGATTGGEVESDIVQANFIVSDESSATRRSGDPTFKKIYDIFRDGYPTDSFLRQKGYDGNYTEMLEQIILEQESGTTYSLNDIQKLHEDNMEVPAYGKNDSITLKSVSSKPNTATTYTWTFYGWDWDKDGGWGKIIAGSEDLDIMQPPTTGLSYIDKDKTDGSEITIRLRSWNSRIGVNLKIDTKSAQSYVSLPACIHVVGKGS